MNIALRAEAMECGERGTSRAPRAAISVNLKMPSVVSLSFRSSYRLKPRLSEAVSGLFPFYLTGHLAWGKIPRHLNQREDDMSQ